MGLKHLRKGQDMNPDQQLLRYLAELQAAMTGLNAATIHDALVDAENHLRTALRSGVSIDQAINDYGSPQEIARAYFDEEQQASASQVDAGTRLTAPHPEPDAQGTPSIMKRFRQIPIIKIWADPRAWGSAIYFLVPGFAIALASFVWVLLLGSLSIAMTPFLIGIPLFIFLMGSVRVISLFQGKLVELMIGIRMPHRMQPVVIPVLRGSGAELNFWRRIRFWLTDIRSWLSLAYLLGNFFVIVILFSLFMTLAAVTLVLVLAPLWELAPKDLAMIPQVSEGFVIRIGWFDWITVSSDASLPVNMRIFGQQLSRDANGVMHLPGIPAAGLSLVGIALATGTLWLAKGTGYVYGLATQAIQVARPQPIARRYTFID